VVDQIDGPVLLVGLVFVAAFAPDEGERLGEVEANSTDSILDTALVQRQYPTGQDSETRWSSPSTPPCSARRLPPTCRPSRPR
jgi:hypothetical protein